MMDRDNESELNLGWWSKVEQTLRGKSRKPSEIPRPQFPRVRKLNDHVHEVDKLCGSTHGEDDFCTDCRRTSNFKPSVEIVFFHGLQFEVSEEPHVTTWLSRNRSELWLNWLHEDIPNARILTVFYDAFVKKMDTKGRMDMFISAENLRYCLARSAQVGQSGCPVVLVGHCLGGLVMKEVCNEANAALGEVKNPGHDANVKYYANFLERVKGFFCYATPHMGLDLSFLNHGRTAFPKGPLCQDMGPLNTSTQRRNEKFQKLRTKYGWKAAGVGARDEAPLKDFQGRTIHVPEASTRYNIDSTAYYTVSADHFDVCRPVDKRCAIYQMLHQFVDTLMNTTGEYEDPKKERTLPFQRDAKYVPIPTSIAAVQTALESMDEPRVVMVHGEGGLGKTSLLKYIALHYHKASLERAWVGPAPSQAFPDGVFFLTCGQGASTRTRELQQELLAEFESEATTGRFPQSNVPKDLRNKLASRKLLIILDDVWERKVLEELLIPGEFVTYLISSRKRDIWENGDAKKIQIDLPCCEDAKKILFKDGDLPEDVEIVEIIEGVITAVKYHPLMLANLGLAMGELGRKSLHEWKKMAKGWRDELQRRDFNFKPTIYRQSYEISMSDTMILMMESLEKGAKRFLLLMSLLGSGQIEENLIKLIRKGMEPGEEDCDYRRYRNQLYDNSLLAVHHSRRWRPDTECRMTYYLEIHPLRAICIREAYRKELKSLAKRAFEDVKPIKRIDSYSAEYLTSARESQTFHTLTDRDSGPINRHPEISMIIGGGSCGGGVCGEEQVLSGVLTLLYVDQTLLDAALGTVCTPDSEIIPRSECTESDVDVMKLITNARLKSGLESGGQVIEKLVEMLNPDGVGWEQVAHNCATKIIVRLIMCQKLDDESVAQLIKLGEHTNFNFLYTLANFIEVRYWDSKFVYQNVTFSNAHPLTTKALLDVLYNVTTPIDVLEKVCVTLGLVRGFGVLCYEDEENILKIGNELVKLLADDTTENRHKRMICDPVPLVELVNLPARGLVVMFNKIPNLCKIVLRLLLLDKVIWDVEELETIRLFCEVNSFASAIVRSPAASDMVWALVESNDTNLKLTAVKILLAMAKSLGEEDRERMCENRQGLKTLIVTCTIKGASLKRLQVRSSSHMGFLNYTKLLQYAVRLLGNFAINGRIRSTILNLCPKLLERLQSLQESLVHSFPQSAIDLSHSDFCAHSSAESRQAYGLMRAISETRTIIALTPVSSGSEGHSSLLLANGENSGHEAVLHGTFDGCFAMNVYKEGLDVIRDLNCLTYAYAFESVTLSLNVIYAKAMVKDYWGARALADSMLTQGDHSSRDDLNYGVVFGSRGVLTRLLGGDLAQAIDDFDKGLHLFQEHMNKDKRRACEYCALKQRGYVKYLMGDNRGAKEDAQAAQQLESRNLVWALPYMNFLKYSLLQLPVSYLDFEFKTHVKIQSRRIATMVEGRTGAQCLARGLKVVGNKRKRGR